MAEYKGCENCGHTKKTEKDYPCNVCRNAYKSQWTPKEKTTIESIVFEWNRTHTKKVPKDFIEYLEGKVTINE